MELFEGIDIIAISPSTPEEHQQAIDFFGYQFDIVTDINHEFGIKLGFVNVEEGTIFRGFVGVNPDTQILIKEVDYLVGENVETIAERLEDL